MGWSRICIVTSTRERLLVVPGASSVSEPAQGRRREALSVLPHLRKNRDVHVVQGGSGAPFRDRPLGAVFLVCKSGNLRVVLMNWSPLCTDTQVIVSLADVTR